MGKNKYGIMGPVSGKVGTVVVYKWKGKDVMRAHTRRMTNPRTPAQQLHRAKFKVISLLASDLLPLIKRGYNQLAAAQSSTETGLFVKSNWPLLEAAGVDDVSIQLNLVAVSKGSLPGVEFGTPEVTDDRQQSTVRVAFTTVDKNGAVNDDYVYLGMYCPAINASLLSAPAKRLDKTMQMGIPAAMLGKEVHLYGFAVGSDFNTRHKYEASDSYYLGTIGG